MLSPRRRCWSSPGRASDPRTITMRGSSPYHGLPSAGFAPTMRQPAPSSVARRRSPESISTTAISPPSMVDVVAVADSSAGVASGWSARWSASPAGTSGGSLRSSACHERSAATAAASPVGRSPSTSTMASGLVVVVDDDVDDVVDDGGRVVAVDVVVVGGSVASEAPDEHEAARRLAATRALRVGRCRRTVDHRTVGLPPSGGSLPVSVGRLGVPGRIYNLPALIHRHWEIL